MHGFYLVITLVVQIKPEESRSGLWKNRDVKIWEVGSPTLSDITQLWERNLIRKLMAKHIILA